MCYSINENTLKSIRLTWFVFIGLFISLVTGSCDLIKPEKSEMSLLMKDSVLLSTNVFIPKRWGTYPAILIRTPYNKEIENWVGDAFGIFGVAVVIQDVRGKYKSGGEYYPFIREREDGLETLRWIREQTWSNGIVGGWGTSYAGYTQWAIADSLDYMVPLLAGANLYDFFYPGGLFSLQSALTWGLTNASVTSNGIAPGKITESFSILPVSSADDSTIRDIQYLNDWISHDTEDDYWKRMSHRGRKGAPVLCIAGWYDIFLKSQIEDFKVLSASGNPESRMIIGPWGHGPQGVKNEYGGIDRTGNPRKIFSHTVKILKGKKKKLPSPLTDKRYNLFIMEKNEYFGSDTWPPAETEMTPWYLGPEGYIGPAMATKESSASFSYDPLEPYPSFGGTVLGEIAGPALQNDNLSRMDQVIFQTEVLDTSLVLLGPVTASLWVESTTHCTDFIVCLQDVFADGRIINIQEGGAEVHSESTEPVMKEISVWATGYQLNPGHKLRVVITSSLFPRFNRNLNDCVPASEAINPVTAEQKVFFGPEKSSCIMLPVFYVPAD